MTLADLAGFFSDPTAQDDMKRRAVSLAQLGARGFTTGLLGAPVDIANTMLGGVGGERPVMGGEWIGQKLQGMGLLSPPAQDTAGSATEFAGGLLNPGGAVKGGAAALAAIPKLAKYQGGDVASTLNHRLREGLPLGDTQGAADEALHRMRPLESQKVLWRGVKSGPFAGAKVGDTIPDKGFVSTSERSDVAANFANRVTQDAALLRIHAPKGTPHAYLPEEAEHLLPPGLSYRVVDKNRKSDGTLVIGLEIIR
jgi:hypothetical protein